MTAPTPAIETRQFSKSFGQVQALAPLDLVVPHGAIFALVGQNGAGKTTLIKLLLNILQPTSGSATVLSNSAAGLTGESFRHIGYVSEDQEMPDWMTVQAYMDYLRPFYPTWNDANLLADLDLPPDRKLKHLSRGMRMKAAFASVLAFRPSLILMDEPFSGLDPVVRDELIESLVQRIRKDRESADGNASTIFVSSHDLAEVESFATHVGFLQAGKLLFAEPLPALNARFREVMVTFAPAPAPSAAPPGGLPASWLLPEATPSGFHFIHTRVDTEPLDEQVHSVFPQATGIDAQPMTLRTIFLALVKSSRTNDRTRA